jgi:hypothetical protein
MGGSAYGFRSGVVPYIGFSSRLQLENGSFLSEEQDSSHFVIREPCSFDEGMPTRPRNSHSGVLRFFASVAAILSPAADADKLSVAALCKVASLSEVEALNNARKHGIIIEDVSLSVAKIAKQHDISPEQVFLALRAD